jgi:hypothetical protein
MAAVAWLAVAGCEAERQTAPAVPVDPCVEQPCTAQAVAMQLARSYQNRDYAHFSRLFHDEFLFILHPDPSPDPTLPPPPTDWGTTEELRIHRRMFEPPNIPPNEEPLPEELWLTGISITITPAGQLMERSEFYQGPENPNGLDRQRWKVWGGEYNASVLFETRGETDYQLTSTQWFVIAQDLTKTPGDARAFSLYRWQDLGGPAVVGVEGTSAAVEPASWSLIKNLYR